MEKNKTVLVLGLGRFGQSLCERLLELGQRVVAVDMNKDVVEAIADRVELAAQLDVTDESALEKIGAREVDIAIVAIGGTSEASIMATALLHGFKIPTIVARADSVLMAKILAQLGANRVVFPAKEMGQIIADKVVHPSLFRFSRLPGEDMFVGEVEIHPDMAGRTLHQMEFRKTYNATVLMVERGGRWIIPRPDDPIQPQDRFMISGTAEDIEKLMETIKQGRNETNPNHKPERSNGYK